MRRSLRQSLISGIAKLAPGQQSAPTPLCKWFEVRFYPPMQDLVVEEITTTQPDEQFMGVLRTALEGLQPGP